MNERKGKERKDSSEKEGREERKGRILSPKERKGRKGPKKRKGG